MRLRFPSLGFILLMLGVLLIYVKIPILDVIGIISFFAGLLLPIIMKPRPMDVHSQGSHSVDSDLSLIHI